MRIRDQVHSNSLNDPLMPTLKAIVLSRPKGRSVGDGKKNSLPMRASSSTKLGQGKCAWH